MQPQSEELSVSIREALPADAARIVALAGQLGYDVPLTHAEAQMRNARDNGALLVAVVPRAGVVGWLAVVQVESLIVRSAEIEGLVVEDEFRSSGIGAQLLTAAEEWARKRGCSTLRLSSNVIRERAHAFYVRNGYESLKTQYVFQKAL